MDEESAEVRALVFVCVCVCVCVFVCVVCVGVGGCDIDPIMVIRDNAHR